MRAGVLLLSTLLLAAACTPAAPADPLAPVASPILGGQPASDPAVVGLVNSAGSISCSGTLISSKVVLTAGHCTYGFVQFAAYFGASTPFLPGETIRVQKVIPHPDYTPFDFRHADVGLVILTERATVRPHEWNSAPLDDSWVGRSVHLVGFGFQQPASEAVRRIGDKMEITLPIDHLVGDKEFEYVHGTCNGDSGGPAFHRFPDGVERIVGVTSYGYSGCSGNSGSHRVDPYDAWIRSQLAIYDPPSCERDFRCVAGCPGGVDPDCPCSPDDGVCSPLCQDPDSDADCPPGCGGGDTCTTGCAAPDPDCGDPCQADGFCIEDCPARDPDCPAPVGEGEACASDFACATGTLCVASGAGDQLRCAPTCTPGADACGDGLECRRMTAEIGACVPPLALLRGFDGAGACASVPGRVSPRGAAWPLGLLLASAGVRWARRRRRLS